ncbi:MAG TPA: ABC transporter ATP-binding protein [Methylomirabilota bacterium]|nr:ABC transporter ATP-binding protein [Methylomirabilota bacterium]
MLEVEQIELFYGDAPALAGVSFAVPRGEIVSLVGANGAGKTSLIRVIAGIAKPRCGQIVFAGRDITGLQPHEICELGIGQVAEGRQLFPSLTTYENLQMGALLPRARKQMAQSVKEVFTLFPILRQRKKQLAGTLSGGEQQMLAIGRCLMGRPELILFDEPSLGLAPQIVGQLFRAIRSLQQKGLTILLVEQNVAASLKISQHAYVLENGRIALSGSGAELLDNDRVRRAFLGR